MSTKEYKHILTRGLKSELDNTNVLDGTLRFVTDTQQLMLDNGTTRVEFTDVIKGLTESQIKSTLAPLPKLYLSSDTHKLYIHTDAGWVICGEQNPTSVNHATTADSAAKADSATKATQDGNGKVISSTYAPINSPSLTGSPKAPTAAEGNNSTQIANTSFVNTAIKNAIAGVVEFDTLVVASKDKLPETGKKGVIYFVANGSTVDGNIYDEYVWVTDTSKYEKIGSADIDLGKYVNDVVVTGTGNAITAASTSGNRLTLTKGASFLTQHPSITKSADTTKTLTPAAGDSISVVKSITRDTNGHITTIETDSVKLPTNVTHAASADSAGTADKLNAAAGSTSQPIYIDDNGKPTAINYTIGKSVPSNALFTDHTYSAGNGLDLTSSTFKLKEICESVTDWNNATTNGWYMASGASNAPVSGSQWFYGIVIAHHTNYVRQILFKFASGVNSVIDGTGDRYERIKSNGTWGEWVNTSVRSAVPSNAKFTDTWRGIQNNLTSDSTTDSLSAAQGKALKSLVDGKASSSHTHNYAGSSSAGGSATSAVKLDTTTAGSSTQPVYFTGGKPTAIGFTIGKSVPADALFTDHTYGTMKGASSSADGSSGLVPAPTTGKQGQFLRGDGTWAAPTDHTYSPFKGATSSANGGSGLVPAPLIGNKDMYLKGDGTWDTPPDHTYTLSSFGINASAAELNYTKGVTSAVQTQLNGKAASSHTHNYAGSSSAGGSANSAVKLATARTINGVNFDGTSNITIDAAPKITTLTNEDLNTIQTYGEYYAGGSNSVTNKPDDVNAFGMKVYRTATGYIIQELFSSNAPQSKMFIRGISGSGADAWQQVYSTNYPPSKSAVGLGNVENKNSATIRGELTSDNVTKALGYTPSKSDHTHSYAGSSSAGGSANSAVKLDTSTAGSTTQPVYFTGGKPTAIGYSIAKSVPADAKFTDTTYSTMGAASSTGAGSSGLVPAPAAGKQGQFLRGDGTWATPTDHTYSLSSFGISASAAELNYMKGVTSAVQTQLNGKAASKHTHGSDDITSLSASKLTGTIDIARLPQGALERCVIVADDIARFALTTDKVQTGDTVKVTGTGKMYFVVDDTKLSSDAGYEIYTAGSATSVPWSGITGKPSTYTPSSHNHTISNITDIGNASVAKATNDSAGNNINSTYIKSLAVSGRTITYTKGNGTEATITTQDTTYSNMKGATSSAAGSAGLVPAPAANNQSSFLRGDGTWAMPTDTKYTLGSFGITASAAELNYVKGVTSSIQTQLDGKAASSHSHNYAGSSSAGGSANSAVKLDTATAGSSTQPVYFSGGKPVATTYTLGKSVPADAVFTDTKYSLSSFGVNASATELNYTKGVTSAVQTQLNGKAASSHTHNYAGSSSAGGSANSAVKLATARTVSGGTDITLSFNYDGSANSTASLGYYSCKASNGNKNNYPYHRFAKLGTQTGSYSDKSSTFLITQDYQGGGFGIVTIRLRTNNVSNKETSNVEIKWLVRNGLAEDSVQVGLYNVAGSTYADAFFITAGTYNGTVIRNLASGARGSVGRTWELVNSVEADNTTTSSAGSSTESYVSIAAAGTALHNQSYTTTVKGYDSATVSYAVSSGKLATVRKIGNASFDGTGDISLSSIGAAASSHTHNYAGSGSVGGSANSAVKLDTTTAGSATQPVYFSGGKPVATTYTLGKSVPSNAVFTDHTYNTMGAASSTAAGSAGLVPAPAAGKQGLFLRGDGTWATPTDHTYTLSSFGITASATELNYVKGVTSSIQTQLNNKAASSHTHNYAGASSSGGSATSAVKLDTTTAGSATQPVYFSGGKPVATTYTLGKSVPSNAVFTDTNTWRGIQNNLTSDSTTDSLSAAQGKALKSLVDGKASSSHTHNYAGSSSAGGSANYALKPADGCDFDFGLLS